MVKGVNKKIIEVNNPDSIYFEKAVFYLKPNVHKLPDEVSEREIERYIKNLGLDAGRRKSRVRLGRIAVYSAVALVILLIAIILI